MKLSNFSAFLKKGNTPFLLHLRVALPVLPASPVSEYGWPSAEAPHVVGVGPGHRVVGRDGQLAPLLRLEAVPVAAPDEDAWLAVQLQRGATALEKTRRIEIKQKKGYKKRFYPASASYQVRAGRRRRRRRSPRPQIRAPVLCDRWCPICVEIHRLLVYNTAAMR